MSINRGMNKFSVASEHGGIFQQLEKNELWVDGKPWMNTEEFCELKEVRHEILHTL